jgi:colanic acid/amylovoran biosynthesis glycosyltransferase
VSDRAVVAHSVVVYLPMSENWIHTQIARVEKYRPLVLTKRAENLDAFSVAPQGGEVVAAYGHPLGRVWQKLGHRASRVYPAHAAAVRRHRPRLLHSHFGHGAIADLPLRRRFRLPQVVSVYGADVWRLGHQSVWRVRYRELFREANLILAEGSAMKRRVEDLGCPAARVRVHHLGIDLARIPFRARRPHDDGTRRVLMAGRAIEKKGMIHGLEAFARAARVVPEARLTVMTWGEASYKQDLMAALRQAADAAGIAGRITWLGLEPYDVYLRIVQDSHVFLVPSVHARNGDAEGGCPVTAIELSASGMPVVGFAHCDIPEVVLDGTSGHLAPEGDVASLSEKLTHVLANPLAWPSLGRAGRTHIEAEYDASRQGQRLEAIYDEVLAAGENQHGH